MNLRALVSFHQNPEKWYRMRNLVHKYYHNPSDTAEGELEDLYVELGCVDGYEGPYKAWFRDIREAWSHEELQ